MQAFISGNGGLLLFLPTSRAVTPSRSTDKTHGCREESSGQQSPVRGIQGRRNSGCARNRRRRGKVETFNCKVRINSPGLRRTGGVTAAAGKREDVLRDLNLSFQSLPPSHSSANGSSLLMCSHPTCCS